MKKSNVLLAVLAATALVACAPDKKDKAKSSLNGPAALHKGEVQESEAKTMAAYATSDGFLSVEEMQAVRAKVQAALDSYKLALRADDELDKEFSLSNRPALEARVKELESTIKKIDEAIAKGDIQLKKKNEKFI